jgi:hypothetical protein
MNDIDHEIEKGLAYAEKMLKKRKLFIVIGALAILGSVVFGVNTVASKNKQISGEHTAIAQQINAEGTATNQRLRAIQTATALSAQTATAKAQQTELAISDQHIASTATAQTCLDLVSISLDPTWHRVFCEQFVDNNNKWDVGKVEYEGGGITQKVAGGKYLWEEEKVDDYFGYSSWLDSIYVVDDFYLSVEAQRISGDEAQACYGLIFRAQKGDYYTFVICDDQFYSIWIELENEAEILVHWTSSTTIKPNKVNKLAVLAKGNHFDFFINNELVKSLDNTQFESGIVGLRADIYESNVNSATFEFDNFILISPER